MHLVMANILLAVTVLALKTLAKLTQEDVEDQPLMNAVILAIIHISLVVILNLTKPVVLAVAIHVVTGAEDIVVAVLLVLIRSLIIHHQVVLQALLARLLVLQAQARLLHRVPQVLVALHQARLLVLQAQATTAPVHAMQLCLE